MVTITNDKAAMMIEQALICAAKYRVLALSDSNPLMIRLFEENAIWLEVHGGALEQYIQRRASLGRAYRGSVFRDGGP